MLDPASGIPRTPRIYRALLRVPLEFWAKFGRLRATSILPAHGWKPALHEFAQVIAYPSIACTPGIDCGSSGGGHRAGRNAITVILAVINDHGLSDQHDPAI